MSDGLNDTRMQRQRSASTPWPPAPNFELLDRMLHDLSLHSPADEETAQRLDDLREAAKWFGTEIIKHTAQNREQSLAITSLEQSLQWAIAAVVRHQP